MKRILLFVYLIIPNLTFAQKVSFEIIKDKTKVDEIGAITLYVEVINKSKKDITILKPATNDNQKWRYYDVKIECPEIPEWSGPIQEKRTYSESDLLVIPAKSTVELVIDGEMNANMLACNSKTFQLELFYNANELIKNPETRYCNSEGIEIVKKLSKIKIASKKTNIVIK